MKAELDVAGLVYYPLTPDGLVYIVERAVKDECMLGQAPFETVDGRAVTLEDLRPSEFERKEVVPAFQVLPQPSRKVRLDGAFSEDSAQATGGRRC